MGGVPLVTLDTTHQYQGALESDDQRIREFVGSDSPLSESLRPHQK
jgi:hypothetical protein